MPTLADYLLAGPGGTGGNFGTMSPGEEAVAVTPGSVLDAAARSAYRLGATPRDAMRTAVQPTGGMVSDVDMARALLSEGDIGKRTGEGALTMMGVGGAFPAEANALNMGIKAYHGSPYDFERFDMSKIGTGEGAQAYGHGLYFAEAEPTALEYRKKLAGTAKAPDDLISMPPEARRAITAHADNPDIDALTAAKRAQNMEAPLRQSDPEKLADMITRYREAKRGRMYQVDINADPEHFLDWDKPLSEQSSHVQEALKAVPWAKDVTGPSAMGMHVVPELPEDIQKMAKAGIPGIKYLDQGSRLDPERLKAAEANLARLSQSDNPVDLLQATHAQEEVDRLKTVKPTSNYVVFDDKLIGILKKYGLAGTAGAAGLGDALLRSSNQ